LLLLNQSPQSALQAVVYEYYPHSDRLWKKGDITFSYDPNGNPIEKETSDGRWNYQYDYANRLVAVYKDGVLIKRYLYDHASLRIGAVDPEGQTAIYIYDLQGNLIQEREGGGVRNYIWALGKHLARVDWGDRCSRFASLLVPYRPFRHSPGNLRCRRQGGLAERLSGIWRAARAGGRGDRERPCLHGEGLGRGCRAVLFQRQVVRSGARPVYL